MGWRVDRGGRAKLAFSRDVVRRDCWGWAETVDAGKGVGSWGWLWAVRGMRRALGTLGEVLGHFRRGVGSPGLALGHDVACKGGLETAADGS